jgi:hypothetical protein
MVMTTSHQRSSSKIQKFSRGSYLYLELFIFSIYFNPIAALVERYEVN